MITIKDTYYVGKSRDGFEYLLVLRKDKLYFTQYPGGKWSYLVEHPEEFIELKQVQKENNGRNND